MVHSVMPHKHPLLRSILRILKAVEGVVKINARVRDSPAKKHISVQVKKENKTGGRSGAGKATPKCPNGPKAIQTVLISLP